MKAQRAHLTGSMRVYGKVAEHNSETLSSEDYSNIFPSFDSERKSYTQAHPQNASMSPGIEETEGKEATNDKVTPSSEYIPSEESDDDDDDEFELKFDVEAPNLLKLINSIQLIPTDNRLRRNDFITGENSKMVGNYIRGKTERLLEAGDDYDRFYNRQCGQDDPIEIEESIEEPSLDKIAQEQNDDGEERMLKRYHQGSDFVEKPSKDEFEEMMKYGSPIPDIDNSDIKELIVKLVKNVPWSLFTPIKRSLFQKLRERYEDSFGEMSLFASAKDYDLTKNDEENRSNGRKIDIVWTTLPKLEFAIGEEMLIQSLDNLNTYMMEAGLHTQTENDSVLL
ncbi:hypothetical protein C1646_674294 [Rhizophagus diaphanus]|nr:hypothetical protein C1646_674294 [Rhizophagus diaphanus] [Rhizophagus sp. MUCL 43196]